MGSEKLFIACESGTLCKLLSKFWSTSGEDFMCLDEKGDGIGCKYSFIESGELFTECWDSLFTESLHSISFFPYFLLQNFILVIQFLFVGFDSIAWLVLSP